MTRPKRTTINDVARYAGVGRGTASRVLNGTGSVSEQARTKVQLAARELQYSVDPLGRSLKRRRTYSIGVIIDTFRGHVNPRILEGIDRHLKPIHYYMSVSETENATYGEPLSVSLIERHRVEGLIVVYHGHERDTYTLIEALPPDLPIVTVGYAPDNERVFAVGIANGEASYTLTGLLTSAGRRNICVITGPAGHREATARLDGFRRALTESGAQTDERRVFAGDWSAQSGYERAREALERFPSLDGIVAQDDWMAIGAIRAIEDSGRKVPDDVSVVGFNDVAFAAFFRPALTTAVYPAYELGNACARHIVEWIETGRRPERPAAGNPSLDPKIIVRDSCGSRRR
ncbi:MAG TPA: LacI family DNA-binding transcriptional regulator [Spirochaetia bacterium]|nr:LacI family DNA-binding transcriptional regulator [Spirochaetia bacterium]